MVLASGPSEVPIFIVKTKGSDYPAHVKCLGGAGCLSQPIQNAARERGILNWRRRLPVAAQA